ncbi:MAG: sulfate permease [Actinobacteria bacterium]|nr:sulfate permease [Actinomycetota bacterium]
MPDTVPIAGQIQSASVQIPEPVTRPERVPGPTGVARFVPILHWSRNYPKPLFRGDLVAGLTVAVMLVPQAMAYANLAGMPPVTGLYAAIVGIIAYALLGTSGSLAVGPVAITSLLTLSGLQTIVTPEDPSYPAVAALLALIVGAVLLLAGILRLGFLVNFLSHPVISGFTSAAAITIGLSQVKDLLGLDIGRPEGVIETLKALAGDLGATNGWTLGIGIASIVALVLGKRLAPKAPTALVVLAVATLGTWLASLTDKGVAILGDVPTGLPSPKLPEFSGSLLGDLAPVALTIAIIAYAEGVSVAKAIARRTREKVDANQELVATGASNLASGLFGGFPIAGGFSRTAVNHSAGARTPLASLITAGVLTIAVLWLTPALRYLPKAVLAGVVVVAVAGLVDISDAKETFRTRRVDFAALLVTFLATLLIGVEPGLAIGLGFSLVMFIYRSSNPHTTELGRVEGTSEFRNVDRWPTRTSDHIAVLRVDGPLFFANTKSFEDRVATLVAERPDVDVVVIDASGIGDLDASGAHLLHELDDDLTASGVTLRLATVRGPVRDVMQRAGVWDHMAGRIHPSIDAAVAAVDPTCPLLDRDSAEQPTEVV